MNLQSILKKEYPVKEGIIQALDSASNFSAHEEALGEQMDQKLPTHIKEDWEASKFDFWSVARKEEAGRGGVVAYIGAGKDTSFEEFDSGTTFINVDLVSDLLIALRNHGAQNLIQASVENLPFKDNSIDAIFIIDLLHHFATRDLMIVLTELNRVLKPGGRMYIEEINTLGFFRLPLAILPLTALNQLRKLKSKVVKGRHEPEAYEAPLWETRVEWLLNSTGSYSFKTMPCTQYPETNRYFKVLWRLLRLIPGVNKYLSFHWFLIAAKRDSA